MNKFTLRTLRYFKIQIISKIAGDKKICIDGESNPGRDEFVMKPSLKAGWQRPVIPLHYQCLLICIFDISCTYYL